MRKPEFNKLSGFTLIELMVSVIIVGILVALVVPSYMDTREKAHDREAISSLMLIRAANKQYRSKFEHFFPYTGTLTMGDINNNLQLDLIGDNWAYTVAGTGTAYTARAQRGGRTWSITESTPNPSCSPAAACP